VRWTFQPLDPEVTMPPLKGISFNYVGSYDKLHPQEIYSRQNEGAGISLYFTLGINRFNGNEYIQLMVNRIAVDEL
jgi:single-stranded-DNA-specific exonuclease